MTHDDVLLIPPRPDRGACIKLQPGVTLVGRAARCDVVLTDTSVSRHHAELFVEKSTISVRDLGSQNGTYVDEQRVVNSPIEYGQQLRFGNVAFVVATNGFLSKDPSYGLETAKLREPGAPATAGSTRQLLSAAQCRVFDLLVEGLAEKQIARKLDLSRHTVHNHVRDIYRTLSVHSRAELLARFVPGSEGEPTISP